MRKSTLTFGTLFLALSLFVGCGDVPTSTTDTGQVTEDSTSDTAEATPSLSPPECTINGEVLEGNQVWDSGLDLLAVIRADKDLANEDDILSHRIFEVLDGRTCETKFTTTLKENISPDYPYYLADIQYNAVNNYVGIQGHSTVYICDLANNFAMSELKPSYFTEREYADAQSGMILHLEVWEDYLLGYAQDCGPFAFNLNAEEDAQPILPFAEWQNTDDGRFHSLFLMPSGNGGQQVLLPHFDSDSSNFVITPVFDGPKALSTNIPTSARNNRFLVLRGEGNADQVFPIDMKQRQLIELPAEVAQQATQDILEWMRRNVR